MKKKKESIREGIFEEYFTPHLSKSQRRRLDIVEATIRLYASTGVDNVTYELLAKEAKASRGIIQHYYPDLSGLAFETMKYIRARLQKYAVDSFINQTNSSAMIECYVNSVFDWAKKFPNDARVWILFLYYCSFKPEFKKLNTDLVRQGYQRICALIEHGVHKGEFRVKNIPLNAKLIQLAINGGFLEIMSESRMQGSPDIRQATIDQCLKLARGEH